MPGQELADLPARAASASLISARALPEPAHSQDVASRRTAPPAGAASTARRTLCLALAGCACAVAAGPTRGQAMAVDAWPARPVRVVVGTPAGSTYDLMLRTMQQPLRAALGQPIVIEHRVGADQILVVEDGRIVERGKHAELLGRGGLYADLYRTQYFEDSTTKAGPW